MRCCSSDLRKQPAIEASGAAATSSRASSSKAISNRASKSTTSKQHVALAIGIYLVSVDQATKQLLWSAHRYHTFSLKSAADW
jgi:hypothetical protein